MIATVHALSRDAALDLELPAEVAAGALAQMLAEVFWGGGQPTGFWLEAWPPGRVLAPVETLESAGVWDGAWLVLHHPADPTGDGEDRPLT